MLAPERLYIAGRRRRREELDCGRRSRNVVVRRCRRGPPKPAILWRPKGGTNRQRYAGSAQRGHNNPRERTQARASRHKHRAGKYYSPGVVGVQRNEGALADAMKCVRFATSARPIGETTVPISFSPGACVPAACHQQHPNFAVRRGEIHFDFVLFGTIESPPLTRARPDLAGEYVAGGRAVAAHTVRQDQKDCKS
jgi:hypothetical protein